MKAIIHTDGGARPTNPGHAGFCCVVEIDGEQHVISRYIGWHSNNVAEYHGVIVGLKYAAFLGATQVELITDSQLVKNHVLGKWKIKNTELKPFVYEVISLLESFDKWSIKWVKREHNKKADGLCTSAIYAGMAKNPFVRKRLVNSGKEIDPFKDDLNGITKFLPNGSSRAHARMLIRSINYPTYKQYVSYSK